VMWQPSTALVSFGTLAILIRLAPWKEWGAWIFDAH
jgi:hypothetical protein